MQSSSLVCFAFGSGLLLESVVTHLRFCVDKFCQKGSLIGSSTGPTVEYMYTPRGWVCSI